MGFGFGPPLSLDEIKEQQRIGRAEKKLFQLLGNDKAKFRDAIDFYGDVFSATQATALSLTRAQEKPPMASGRLSGPVKATRGRDDVDKAFENFREFNRIVTKGVAQKVKDTLSAAVKSVAPVPVTVSVRAATGGFRPELASQVSTSPTTKNVQTLVFFSIVAAGIFAATRL